MTSPSSATHATRTAESPHNARSNSSLKGINQISCNAGEEPKFFVLTLGKAGGPCGTFLPPCIRYHLTSLAYSRWYGSPKKICRCWHMVLLEECVMISLMNIDQLRFVAFASDSPHSFYKYRLNTPAGHSEQTLGQLHGVPGWKRTRWGSRTYGTELAPKLPHRTSYHLTTSHQ